MRQVLLLLVIIALALLLFSELYLFFPGFLGAITIYVLSRDRYRLLVDKRKRNPSATAMVFMLLFLLCIGLPIYLAVDLLSAKISLLISNQQEVVNILRSVSLQVKKWTGQEMLTDGNIIQIQKKLSGMIPGFLNSTATILSNLGMMMFLVFFMFTNGIAMEKTILGFIPLQRENINILSAETKNMVRANALGIPLISIIQGTFALLGYWIFGVKDFVLWGFITGIFAFFPIVGTMLIWVPLVIYVYSSGNTFNGTGLLLYSLLITGNVDYFARITLLKKIGNVHPITTVLGVIVGLQLFGFLGFIFGPLLISYFLLLIKIYSNEFGSLK